MAVAGHAGLLGFDVTLCDIRPEAVASVQEQGGIAVSGKQEGFAPISLATASPAAVRSTGRADTARASGRRRAARSRRDVGPRAGNRRGGGGEAAS